MTNGPEPEAPGRVHNSCTTVRLGRSRIYPTRSRHFEPPMMSSVVRSVCLVGTVCPPILCRNTAHVKGANSPSLTGP